jgi:phage/plasmid-like protein (TIGR03299 family)
MAHQIYDGRMMYAGETPWHGLGTALPANVTWAEAKELVGFYEAIERPLFVPGRGEELPDVKALVAGDDGRYLATVGIDYGVVQFDQLAEAVMQACQGEAVFHTAGLLGDRGERGFLTGELKRGAIKVDRDESPLRPYFMAHTGHTGMHAASLVNCTTRPVCANTVGAALSERGGFRATIRHTSNADQAVKAAGLAFAKMVKGFEKFGELANLMARTNFSDLQFSRVLDDVAPMPNLEVAGKRAVENAESKRGRLTALNQGAMKGASGITGTAWGAFQAVTEYADHHAPRMLTADSGARLNSIVFGSAADFKKEALASILNIAGVKAGALASL